MSGARDRILARRLIAIVRLDDAAWALPAAEALIAGGVDILELTLTTPGALTCLRQLATRYGERILLGAGTVLDVAQAEAALDAGARFLVSPALHLPMIARAHRRGALALPGALTPTEIVTAWEHGADFVKVFPCDAVGGAAYLKAIRGLLPHIPLVPTGGVTLETAGGLLAAGAVALGAGSALLSAADCAAGAWDRVQHRAAQWVAATR